MIATLTTPLGTVYEYARIRHADGTITNVASHAAATDDGSLCVQFDESFELADGETVELLFSHPAIPSPFMIQGLPL